MDFTLNNGLSMIGGDDFTNLYQEIDTLNDTVVFKAGTQTITGNKTITGDLVVLNSITDIEGDDVLLRSGGDTKYSQNATTSIIDNTDIVQLRLGGSSVFSALAFPHDTTITGNDNVYINSGTTKIDITPVTTLMNNTNTYIQSGGVTKISNNNVQTLVENDTVILSNTAETAIVSVLANSVLTIAPVGGEITMDIGANTKQDITNTLTTLTNPTITNVATTAFRVQNVAGTDKLSIAPSLSSLTNTTHTINSTTQTNLQINNTNRLFITDTNYVLQSATLSPLNIVAGTYSVYQAGESVSVTAGTTMSLSANTSITNNVNGVTKLSLAPTATTLTNTNVNVVGSLNVTQSGGAVSMIGTGLGGLYTNYYPDGTGAGRKAYIGFPNTGSKSLYIANQYTGSGTQTEIFVDGSNKALFGLTTTDITNTSINAVGSLYSQNYRLGASGSSNRRLASMTIPGGSCLIPTASGAGTTTTNGNWSPSGTSAQIRTPDWGNFVPLYVMVGFDSGTITGGGTMTFAVQIRDESNNFTIGMTPQTLTSGTLNASTANAQDLNVYSSVNQDIGSGVLIRFQLVVTRTASITASTKTCYATFYGYQTV